MEKEKIGLSIVILSYNSKIDLAMLLPSVFASETKYSYEVIVVDNGSRDDSADFVQNIIDKRQFDLSAPAGHLPTPGERNIVLLRNQNEGFAHGNNLGIRQAQ